EGDDFGGFAGEGVGDFFDELGERKGLAKNVVDQGVQAVGAFALVGEAGHQKDGEVGELRLDRKGEADAVHDGHLDVGDQKVEAAGLVGHDFEREAAIGGFQNL